MFMCIIIHFEKRCQWGMTKYNDLRQQQLQKENTLNGASFSGVSVPGRTVTGTYALSSAKRGHDTASRR